MNLRDLIKLKMRVLPLVLILLLSVEVSIGQTLPTRPTKNKIETLYPVRVKRVIEPQDYPFDQSTFTNNVIQNNSGRVVNATAVAQVTCKSVADLAGLSATAFADAVIADPTYQCYYGPLYNFDATHSPSIHSNANVQEVLRRIKTLGATYDGTNASGLYALITYLHQTVFHEGYQSTISLDATTMTLYKEAVDVMLASPNLITLTEDGLTTLYEFGTVLDRDDIRPRTTVMNFMKDRMKDLVTNDTWKGQDSKLEFYYGRAYNQIFFITSRGKQAYKDAAAADTEFVDLVASLTVDDELHASAAYDFIVGNAVNELVRLSAISSISGTVCDKLDLIVKKYERLHPRWISAVNGINANGDCSKYNLCMSADDIKKEVTDKLFPNQYKFDNDNLVINTPLGRRGVQELYHALKEVKAQFYRMQQTDLPTTGDTNETLKVFLFGSPEEYRMYATYLFGIATNNGGMYIEQIATFYTFDRTSGLPLEALFRHEYVHYLQGRNWVPGYWGEVPFYNDERLTSLEEGGADFFSGATPTDGIKILEQNIYSSVNDSPNWPTLKTILKHEYNNSTAYQYLYGSMVWHNWYLNDYSKIKQLIDLLRADDVTGYDNLMDALSADANEEAKWRAHLAKIADGSIKGWDPSTDWINDSLINAQTIAEVKTEYIATTSDNNITTKLAVSTGNRRFELEGTLKGSGTVTNATEAAQSIDKAMDELLILLGKNSNINNFRYSVGYYKNITINGGVAQATFVIDGPLRNSNVNDAPVSDFGSNITTVREGGEVDFVDQTSGYPTSYSWTFSGGTPSSSNVKNPTVKYTTIGQYDVTLSASNSNSSSSKTKNAYINVIEDTWKDAVYLSDLTWQSATVGYGEVRKDASSNGKKIEIDGIQFDKGIGTHAESTIIYALGDNYTRFLADVGVDDETIDKGSVAFEVWADGVQIFASGTLISSSALKSIDVNISGVSELKLIASDGGDGINSDHADWGGARVIPSVVAPDETKVWLEAETAGNQANFSPFTIVDDNAAANSKYIVIPNGGGDQNMNSVSTTAGELSYNFNLSGTVAIWLRVHTPNTSDDSYWLKIDSDSYEKQNDIGASSGWTWIKWKEATLAAGSHTLSLARREDGTKIDKFLFTTDLSFVPTGTGDQSTADTESPSIPNDLSVANITATGANISWTAATDNVAVTSYTVFSNGTQVGTSANTSFALTGLTASTAYSITLKAKDATGNESATSAGLSVTTSAVSDTQAPSIPQGLQSSNITANSADISWTASADNVAVTNYTIYSNGTQVGTSNNTSFALTGLTASTTYSVTVTAKDAANNVSAASSALSVATIGAGSTDYTYLSDLTWVSAAAGWGSVNKDANVTSGSLVIGGTTYTKGLGTHATSEIIYNLGGSYQSFLADIGIDDGNSNASSSITFQVMADGASIYQSGTITQSTGVTSINVSMAGVNELKLIVGDAGDGINSDWADWADAKLTAGTTIPSTEVWLEAESASSQTNFSPFTVSSDANASGGQYIVIPNGSGNTNMSSVTASAGELTYDFNLSGTVAVWLRVHTPNAQDDSYWLKVNNGTYEKQNDLQASTDWTWLKWKEVTLTAGSHALSLASREDGTKIDKLLFTTDLSLTPSGVDESGSSSTRALTNSLNSNLDFENILVYPNPTKGFLRIDLGDQKKVKLEVISISGKIAFSEHYSDQKVIDLDFSPLSEGSYLIKMTTAEKSIVKRIVYVK